MYNYAGATLQNQEHSMQCCLIKCSNKNEIAYCETRVHPNSCVLR